MADSAENLTVRAAVLEDWPVIAEFNIHLALESEDRQLHRPVVEAGVRALLAEPSRGRYFVVCRGGRVIGQLMHTREWSDWRNGDIWWIQSVYVHPDFRRAGAFRRLLTHLNELAEDDPQVVGLRLYVEDSNTRAQQTYESLGLTSTTYHVMERLFV